MIRELSWTDGLRRRLNNVILISSRTLYNALMWLFDFNGGQGKDPRVCLMRHIHNIYT